MTQPEVPENFVCSSAFIFPLVLGETTQQCTVHSDALKSCAWRGQNELWCELAPGVAPAVLHPLELHG